MWLALVVACGRGCVGGSTETAQPAAGCESCHVGIEPAHVTMPDVRCSYCHGGDEEASDKDDAHVVPPDDYWQIRGSEGDAPFGYIKDFTPDQLDQLPLEYLRFINPGDIRVAEIGCGRCHEAEVELVKRSVMTTNTGHYWPTRYYAGLQDAEAIYGSTGADDPACDPDLEGTVCEVQPLYPRTGEELEAILQGGDVDAIEGAAYDHYLAKKCNHCHAAAYGKNNSGYMYRSSGCSSCHSVYGKDGVYEGDDQAMPRGVPVYAKSHTITTAIPTEQCATCHFQGGRIGLNFRGIREHGFSEVPEHGEPWSVSAYGHVPGYYYLDDDTTNDVDETPPDLHYEAGMHCVDCHVGSDVHGDGHIHSSSKGQLDLRCEDCHGDGRAAATADGDGVFRTSGGRALPQLASVDGQVVLTGAVDGAEHVVPQPAEILASGEASDAMHAAMADDEDGWAHPDSVTCDTCHGSWQLWCIGCHVTMDFSRDEKDFQTGQVSPGAVYGSRYHWKTDGLLLGRALDGRAQSVNPSQHVQMAVMADLDDDGEREVLVGDVDADGDPVGGFRINDESDLQAGFAPFFQHTTSAEPRTCDSCHRTDDSPEEWARVRGVYGFGTADYLIEGAGGAVLDPLQFLDEDGQQTSAFAHPGTGPLASEVLDRALAVDLEETP